MRLFGKLGLGAVLAALTVSTIADGTSNTISFAETRNAACFDNIGVPDDVQVIATAAAEPGSFAMLLPAIIGLTAAGYGMRRARSPFG
jgi:hypothetical protein